MRLLYAFGLVRLSCEFCWDKQTGIVGPDLVAGVRWGPTPVMRTAPLDCRVSVFSCPRRVTRA
jgi:hypothetical protein